jgi:hypothetical protein
VILSIILSAASLIAWGFSFIFFKNYLRRRTDPEWILAEWKEEINKLNADMDAATDRNVALVEDRIKSLKEIIKDADRRIALSVREEDKRRAQEAAYAAFGRMAEHTKISSSASPEGGDAAFGRGAGDAKISSPGPVGGQAGDSEAEAAPEGAAPETSSGAPVAGEPAPAAEAPEPPPGPRFVRSARPVEPKPPSFTEQVAELSKAGFSSAMIAANLGVSLAEVELAIAITEGKNFL